MEGTYPRYGRSRLYVFGGHLLSLSGVMEICLLVLRNNAAPLESRNEACDITTDVLESKIPTR